MNDKYVEEKARELVHTSFLGATYPYMEKAKDFIRTIVKDIEDKYWAQEQYYLDTIKMLKVISQKKVEEVSEVRRPTSDKKLRVSRIGLSNLAEDILDSITTSRVVGLLEKYLKEIGVEVEE